MLAALRQDAQKQGVLEKINCICADFAEFSSNKKYDILFAAMTPALFNLEDYSKIANLADKFVYLGWGGKRESALMSEIFAAHGANLRVHNGSNRLKDWLAQNNISFKNEFFDTSWEHSLSLDKAIKDHAWHLKMHDVEPENDKIRAVLEKYIDDRGLITNKTEARLELIIW